MISRQRCRPAKLLRVIKDPKSTSRRYRVLNSGGAVISTTAHSTAVTSARGGPSHSHSHKAATAARSPQAMTSTRPSGKLRA